VIGVATEQAPLDLTAVHIGLRAVDRSAAEAHQRRMRGEDGAKMLDRYAAEGAAIFTPLSDPDALKRARKKAAKQRPRRPQPTTPFDDDTPTPSTPVTYTNLLLLGDAGSGKSTTLLFAALRCADAYLRNDLRLLSRELNAADANAKVRDLLAAISLDSGLLQERNSGYSFTHYTFQEYLAARALDILDSPIEPDDVPAKREYLERRGQKAGPEDLPSVSFLLEQAADLRWRETLLLAAAHWSNGQTVNKTKQLLKQLLARNDDACTILVAEALADIGPGGSALQQQHQSTVQRLPAIAFQPAHCPDPVQRAKCATLLDRLNADVRPALDPQHADYWAQQIAPGSFSMGDDQGEYGDEKPQFVHTIRQPYALARFPVTNRQYFLFTEALAGRGTPEALAAAQQFRSRFPQYVDRIHPRYWPGSRYRAGEGNHPVMGVTWYAATSFAWWLEAWLHITGDLPADQQIRLPTEAEWERAAAYPRQRHGRNPRAGRREFSWGAGPI
jgi:formylglycine-generating enzyme required for sulfatase activity